MSIINPELGQILVCRLENNWNTSLQNKESYVQIFKEKASISSKIHHNQVS